MNNRGKEKDRHDEEEDTEDLDDEGRVKHKHQHHHKHGHHHKHKPHEHKHHHRTHHADREGEKRVDYEAEEKVEDLDADNASGLTQPKREVSKDKDRKDQAEGLSEPASPVPVRNLEGEPASPARPPVEEKRESKLKNAHSRETLVPQGAAEDRETLAEDLTP